MRTSTSKGMSAAFFRGLLAPVAAMAFIAVWALPATPAAQAEGQPILWGAYLNAMPSDRARLATFESHAGKPASILHWGQPWFHDNTYQSFQTSYFQAAREHGSIPMVNWGSWDYCCGTNQPRFRLSEIIKGAHDGYIHQWARAAAAWGHPYFLRFDHEMNGFWQFAWSEQTNGNKPGEFVAAWRHVHDIFVQDGARATTWVWCPNISGSKTTPLAELYPGDDYVDWTCMDGYNWGTDGNGQWQTFADVFGGSAFNGYHNTYEELLHLAPGKPIMIGETGTSRDGGDPGAWVRDALETQLPNNFPRIQALVWFNWNANDPALDWPIESSPNTQAAFAEGITSGYFASNQFGSIDGGPVAAPRRSTVAATTVGATETPAANAQMIATSPEAEAQADAADAQTAAALEQPTLAINGSEQA